VAYVGKAHSKLALNKVGAGVGVVAVEKMKEGEREAASSRIRWKGGEESWLLFVEWHVQHAPQLEN
jgi:hypothetical protein